MLKWLSQNNFDPNDPRNAALVELLKTHEAQSGSALVSDIRAQALSLSLPPSPSPMRTHTHAHIHTLSYSLSYSLAQEHALMFLPADPPHRFPSQDGLFRLDTLPAVALPDSKPSAKRTDFLARRWRCGPYRDPNKSVLQGEGGRRGARRGGVAG